MPDPDQPTSWAPPSYAPAPYPPPSYAPAAYGQSFGSEPAPPQTVFATQPYGPGDYYARPPIEVAVVQPATGSKGLAITGVVLGGLSLLGVLIVLALVLTGVVGDGGGSDSDGASYPPTRGTLAPSATGGLTGAALAAEVTRQMRDQGGSPEGITCPDTVKVTQDVTTVCHGDVSGDEYAFVVFFEDVKGDYTILVL